MEYMEFRYYRGLEPTFDIFRYKHQIFFRWYFLVILQNFIPNSRFSITSDCFQTVPEFFNNRSTYLNHFKFKKPCFIQKEFRVRDLYLASQYVTSIHYANVYIRGTFRFVSKMKNILFLIMTFVSGSFDFGEL